MTRRPDRLYHLAEAENLASILVHGLMSTQRLLELCQVNRKQAKTILRTHRPNEIRLRKGVIIRDQKPMPPQALAGALDDGLSTADWYSLLNGFVFLWPNRDRLERQLRACRGRAQVLLTFDAAELFDHFGVHAFVSPINSGNARRKPAPRSIKTFVPYEKWVRDGWSERPRTHPPAEVVFSCSLPVQAPYLLGISEI